MQLSQYALDILNAESLDAKLAPPPEELGDDERTVSPLPMRPAREARLSMVLGRRAKVPPLEGFADPQQRRRILHAFANHELQAVELFAWALLAFPQTPSPFRRGLLCILRDEQRHTQMYLDRLSTLGASFGDYPISGYFWNKIEELQTPLKFLAAMSLTFENANLDHAIDFAREAHRLGDQESARLLESVHEDEIQHVRFGWRWMRRFKPDDVSMWEFYRENLSWPLHPGRASGREFHEEPRARAGLDDEFIGQLRESRTNGEP